MNVTTANRIYDEIAMIVGGCLHSMGRTLPEDQLALLATDVDRDAGVEIACAIGRLALDTGDLASVREAIEIQKDRVRSIMAMTGPNDPAFMTVHLKDMTEAKAKVQLMRLYMAGNMTSLEHLYRRYEDARRRRV